MNNPFTPTFGIVPPFLAGRSRLLNDMRKSFDAGLGDPNLCSIIVGPRGSGKTALLSCIGEEAARAGWIVVHTVAADGMLEDIMERSLAHSAEKLPLKTRKKVSGLSIGQFFGISWSEEDRKEGNWRSRMTGLLTELHKSRIGLLITVDEVRADISEMITLASVYQLLIREGYTVALVMAGLSSHVNDLMEDKSVSFLRRARQHVLDRLSDYDVQIAFQKTVESAGKHIKDDALEYAVKAIGGYPYMMQLVGYSVWEASASNNRIDPADVGKGVRIASEEFRRGVLKNTLRELSAQDVVFLKAMLQDEERSRLTDVAARMNKTTGYASTYKSRMLDAGIIEEYDNGSFAFAMPAFKQYLEGLI